MTGSETTAKQRTPSLTVILIISLMKIQIYQLS